MSRSCGNHWALLSLVLAIFTTSAAWANEQKTKNQPAEPIVEAPADAIPKWNDKDREAVLMGTLWDSEKLLLPDLADNHEVGEAAPAVSVPDDERSPVDPVPEDFERVHESFLPQYIRPVGVGLIDPQKLLGEVERGDVLVLMERIHEKYGIRVFVSLFAPGQTVPPEVNAPTLARQVFRQSERSMLLHIHLGDVRSMQIAVDQDMLTEMGDKRRRMVLRKVQEHASVYTDGVDQLMEAVVAMAVYVQPDAQAAMEAEQAKGMQAIDNVPPVNIEILEEGEPTGNGVSFVQALKQTFEGVVLQNGTNLIVALVLMLIGGLLFVRWKFFRSVRLKASESDIRLEAPNGAGLSSSYNYGLRENNDPNSVGRRQMRDHMRDIS